MASIILYPADETTFTTQGIGDLSAEATKAEITRQLNGIFEISIDYPQSGKLFEELQTGQIVLTQAEQNKNPQIFEITEIEQNNNGLGITLKGAQIALTRLKYFFVSPFTAQDNTEAIAAINANIAEQAGIFEITADFTANGVFTLDKPKTAATVTFSAILEQYGGELDFDGFEVKQLATLGTARGVVIRYGGNLNAYTLRRTVDDSYNYVMGYYIDNGGGVLYGDFVSVASVLPNVPVIDDVDHRALYLDFSSIFTTAPTKAEITAKTREVITQNADAETWRYKSTADVEYIDLSKTANYKNVITSGDVIQLGDVVTLIITNQDRNAKFGYYEAQKRVIGTTWDILAERYTSLELADPTGQGLTYEDPDNETVTAVTETSILGNNSNGANLTGSDILARIGTTETPEPESGGGGACEKIVGMIPIYYNDGGTEREVAQFGTKGISGANRGIFLDSQYYPITETLGPGVPGVDLSSPHKKTVYKWTDANNVTHATTVSTYTASSTSGTDYFTNITGADRYYFTALCSLASFLFSGVGFTFDIQASEIIAVGMHALRPASTASPLLGTSSNPWTLYGTVITTSDRRAKTDIKPIGDNYGDFLGSLKPVLYKVKNGDGATRAGLIAQEVQEAQEKTKTTELALVREDEKTGLLSINYIELIPILVTEVNKLKEEIKRLKEE